MSLWLTYHLPYPKIVNPPQIDIAIHISALSQAYLTYQFPVNPHLLPCVLSFQGTWLSCVCFSVCYSSLLTFWFCPLCWFWLPCIALFCLMFNLCLFFFNRESLCWFVWLIKGSQIIFICLHLMTPSQEQTFFSNVMLCNRTKMNTSQ